MLTPKVSYIIPAYNCACYVEKTLDSLKRQGVESFEIIVVNDCSTDDTLDVLEAYSKHTPQLTIISHEINRNLGAARNSGLDAARGEYIFFIDSDDWLNDGGVKHLLQVARSKDADVVACGVQTVSSSGEIKTYHAWDFESNGGGEGVNFFSQYKIGAIVWNKLYRRDFLLKTNLRFIEGFYHEDILFTAYIALKCTKYVSISTIYVNYYQNSESIINRIPGKAHLASYLNLYREMTKYFSALEEASIFDRGLIRRVSRNYGAAEVFPKLERYAATRNREQFINEVFDVTFQFFGAGGAGLADVICAMFEKFSPEK